MKLQLLGVILVYIVFIQLFIVLSVYLWTTLRTYAKQAKRAEREQEKKGG